MEITVATTKDLEGILALQTQIYRVSSLPENAQKILESLLKDQNCDIIVARKDKKVAGSAFVFYLPVPAHGAPYAYLEGVVVDSAYRGQGIGTALTQKAITLAKNRGCYKMIFTSGFDRQEIHEFYEKLGFAKWGYEFRMDLD